MLPPPQRGKHAVGLASRHCTPPSPRQSQILVRRSLQFLSPMCIPLGRNPLFVSLLIFVSLVLNPPCLGLSYPRYPRSISVVFCPSLSASARGQSIAFSVRPPCLGVSVVAVGAPLSHAPPQLLLPDSPTRCYHSNRRPPLPHQPSGAPPCAPSSRC